jgi:phosphoribosyl-ATP pyrophosphohydrolase
MPGYHITKIEKGEVGEVSKILEEVQELMDAERQGNRIMALVEASDIYLALMRWLHKHHSGISMEDVKRMALTTKKVFDTGGRS